MSIYICGIFCNNRCHNSHEVLQEKEGRGYAAKLTDICLKILLFLVVAITLNTFYSSSCSIHPLQSSLRTV